jgi:hypothetical protein
MPTLKPIVLLARPNTENGRRETLSIRETDFRSLYFQILLPGSGLSRRIDNGKSSWACSPKSMVDECRS